MRPDIPFHGKAIIFSAPSGSGKTTIVRHLLASNPTLGFSISACTRPCRPHERNGTDYYFLTADEFKQKIQADAFVEWEQVYAGMYYGTLKAEVDRLWQARQHVLFDVDVKGGLNLKKYFGQRALSIFIKVPSLSLLEERLRRRGTESEEKIRQRLEKARYELEFESAFDVTLLNDDLAATLAHAEQLVTAFVKA